MLRTRIDLDLQEIPKIIHGFAAGCSVYDSSCSPNAKVYFLDKEQGYYLKKAAKGALRHEAVMTEFYHSKGLSAQVITYESLEDDWLLTDKIPGEDCTFSQYMNEPVKLCDTTAELLRTLHETSHAGCPIPNRTAQYLENAVKHYQAGQYDTSLFPDNWGYASAEEAWSEIQRNGKFLKADTLLHGDYCLPNILLDNWKFGGFIDLDTAGVGDKHVDLFWGMWSLQFNLKTDKFRERFLDAYGRDGICEDVFRTVAAIEVFG